jgi:protein TonB
LLEAARAASPDEGIELAVARGAPGGVEGGAPGGVDAGVPGGVAGGVVGGLPEEPPPPQPVRVGGAIKQPQPVNQTAPVYPPAARRARVEGVVILECTISAAGRVLDVKVLRGIPLLDDAAVAAVKQWLFAPTLLDGVPVPVLATVTVSFSLKQAS